MNRDEALRILALAEAADATRAAVDESAADDLNARRDEIVPAVEYLASHDPTAACRLVAALMTYWPAVGRLADGARVSEQVAEANIVAATSDSSIAAAVPAALLAAAEMFFRQDAVSQARTRAYDCMRAAMLIEDRATAAVAHAELARIAHHEGDQPELERHSRRILELVDADSTAAVRVLRLLVWGACTPS